MFNIVRTKLLTDFEGLLSRTSSLTLCGYGANTNRRATASTHTLSSSIKWRYTQWTHWQAFASALPLTYIVGNNKLSLIVMHKVNWSSVVQTYLSFVTWPRTFSLNIAQNDLWNSQVVWLSGTQKARPTLSFMYENLLPCCIFNFNLFSSYKSRGWRTQKIELFCNFTMPIKALYMYSWKIILAVRLYFRAHECVLHLELCLFAANTSAYTLKIFQDPGTETPINNALWITQMDASMNINQLFSHCLRCLLVENERLPLDSYVLWVSFVRSFQSIWHRK